MGVCGFGRRRLDQGQKVNPIVGGFPEARALACGERREHLMKAHVQIGRQAPET
jgi:hypothetical protein